MENSIKTSSTIKKSLSYFQITPKNLLASHLFAQNHDQKKESEGQADKEVTWKKYGELMCTRQVQHEHHKAKAANTAFLMLRTEG